MEYSAVLGTESGGKINQRYLEDSKTHVFKRFIFMMHLEDSPSG